MLCGRLWQSKKPAEIATFRRSAVHNGLLLTTTIQCTMMGGAMGEGLAGANLVDGRPATHHPTVNSLVGMAMPKKAAGLTARKVETIKTPGLFADGNGLYLQVTPTGAKTWIFRYQIVGRRRDMGLGSANVVSLADARQKAADAKKLVTMGTDPLETRKAHEAAQALETARAVTFRDCAEAYVESMRHGWKNAKHGAQWSATLETYAYPVMGSLPINGIDTGLVLKVLEPIWTAKTETASRVRGRIESVLDYAKVRGYRSGENPARWKGHLDHILPAKGDVAKVEHHASLPYGEMPAFWPRLQIQDGMGARALEFAILTACRSGEV